MREKRLHYVDERTFTGGPDDGPYLDVVKTSFNSAPIIEVTSNLTGLELLEPTYDGLEVMSLRMSLPDLRAAADRLPDPSKIVLISTGQDLLSDEECDLEPLRRYSGLQSLGLIAEVPKGPRIADVVPGLRFLSVGALRTRALEGLKCLEGLKLISGARHIESCNSAHITKLFVTSAEPSLLEKIASWPALETLALWSRKKDWSFGALAGFPALQNFAFEGPAEQDWMSLTTSLHKVSIEKVIDSAAVGRHLAKSDVVSIGFNPKVKGDDGYYAGDLLEGGDPFRSLECDVFHRDIT